MDGPVTDYCTVADVESELGVSFDGDQTARAETLITAASAFVDTYCGRTFAETDPITEERHQLYAPRVFLSTTPVASVEAVRLRAPYLNQTYRTLTVTTEYELVNPTTGEVRLGCRPYGAEVAVDYTPDQSVPADLSDAVVQMVAARMAGEISGGNDLPDGIKRYEVGNELQVEFFSPSEVPTQALRTLDTLKLHRRVGVI